MSNPHKRLKTNETIDRINLTFNEIVKLKNNIKTSKSELGRFLHDGKYKKVDQILSWFDSRQFKCTPVLCFDAIIEILSYVNLKTIHVNPVTDFFGYFIEDPNRVIHQLFKNVTVKPFLPENFDRSISNYENPFYLFLDKVNVLNTICDSEKCYIRYSKMKSSKIRSIKIRFSEKCIGFLERINFEDFHKTLFKNNPNLKKVTFDLTCDGSVYRISYKGFSFVDFFCFKNNSSLFDENFSYQKPFWGDQGIPKVFTVDKELKFLELTFPLGKNVFTGIYQLFDLSFLVKLVIPYQMKIIPLFMLNFIFKAKNLKCLSIERCTSKPYTKYLESGTDDFYYTHTSKNPSNLDNFVKIKREFPEEWKFSLNVLKLKFGYLYESTMERTVFLVTEILKHVSKCKTLKLNGVFDSLDKKLINVSGIEKLIVREFKRKNKNFVKTFLKKNETLKHLHLVYAKTRNWCESQENHRFLLDGILDDEVVNGKLKTITLEGFKRKGLSLSGDEKEINYKENLEFIKCYNLMDNDYMYDLLNNVKSFKIETVHNNCFSFKREYLGELKEKISPFVLKFLTDEFLNEI